MDSCVYQPPDILKVQIYSFMTEKKKSKALSVISVCLLYIFQDRFYLNFVFGQVHFPLTITLFLKKRAKQKKMRVFRKESIT